MDRPVPPSEPARPPRNGDSGDMHDERLQLALDAAGMGTFIWHVGEDRGEPDARLLALFGLPPGGSISLAAALATLIHPDDRARYAAAVARATDPAGDGALREEIRVRHPGGGERWLAISAQVTFTGEPRRADRMAGVATDITERKRGEEAPRASEERFRLAAQAVAGMLYDNDLTTGRTTYSPGVFDLTGYRPDEISADSGWWMARTHPDDIARARAAFAAARSDLDAQGYSAEYRVPHRDGHDVWVWDRGHVVRDGAGEIVRAVGSVLDITDRKRAEEVLRASEARLRMATEAAEMYTWDHDMRAKTTLFSANTERLIGAPPPETPEEITAYTHPDDRERVAEAGRRAIAEGVDHFEYDFRSVAAPGEVHQFHVWCTIIRDAAGDPVRSVGITQDITARKQHERRQEFILRLSDALRPLADATEIQATACRLIGEHLNVDRAYFVEVDEAKGYCRVREHYGRGDSPSMVGTYRLEDYGWSLPIMRRDETIVFVDVHNAACVPPEYRPALLAIQIVAHIAVPLVRGGAVVGVLCVTEPAPRAWTADDVAMLREVADRLWATVERARAEEALRASEAKYRTLFDSIDEGFCVFELIYDDHGKVADYRFLEVNNAFERQTGLEDAVGKLGSEIAPDTERYWIETYDHVARTGEPQRIENYNRATDRWYEAYASRVGGAGSRHVITVFNDITERKGFERRQVFLLHLSDALRSLSDATAIQATATRTAMDFFGADRCYYCEVIDGDVFIRRDAARGDLPSVVGFYPLSESPIFRAMIGGGKPYAVADVRTTDALDEGLRQTCLQLQILSNMIVPVVKEGNVVGLFCVTQCAPREWTALELALAEEAAERTWAAVERARAEAALRADEERNALLVRFSDAARGLSDPRLVAEAACRILTERLGTERTIWADIDWTAREYVAEWGHRADGTPVAPARWPLDARQPFAAEHLAGRSVVYDDSAGDPRIPDPTKAAMAERGIRSGIVVPVVVDGTLRSVLSTSQRAAPRHWQPEEVTAVEALAGRAWAEIERARAEAALREAEAAMRGAIAAGRFGTWRFDFATQAGEGSARTWEIFGETVPDGDARRITADEWTAFIHPDDRDAAARAFADAAQSGTFAMEYRLHTAAGEARWVSVTGRLRRDADGAPRALEGLIADITERRNAEEALRESEERLRLATEAAAMYAWEIDLRTSIPKVSANFAHITGRASLAHFEENLAAIHPDDREMVRNAFAEAAASGTDRLDYEMRTLQPDGGLRWYRVSGVLIRDAAHVPVRSVGITQDITARKGAEEALRRANERFRVAEIATDGFVYDWDTRSGAVARSDGFAAVLGYAPDEIAATADAWSALIHPEDRAAIEPASPESLGRERDTYAAEYRVRRKAGDYRFVLDRGVAIRDEAGEIGRIVGSTVDITERKRAEAALRESEERFRGLAETVQQMIWIGGDDGAVDYFNAHWYAYTGLGPESRFGDAWHAAVHPEDLPELLRRSERAARTGGDYEIEYRLRRADGTYRWHIARASRVAGIGRWIGSATDVDDLTRAVTALRAGEERFRAVANLVPDLLWESGPDGAAGWYNDRWTEYTGRTTARVTGWGWAEAIHPDDRAGAVRRYREAVAAGAPLRQEYRIRRADGAHRWFVVNASPLADGEGRVAKMYSAATDIDEQRMAREELATRVGVATAQLRALSRQLLTVQEAERRNLARELHDEIGQSLTGLALTLAMARRQPGKGHTERAAAIADDLLQQVRELSLNLRPAVLDDFGLLPAVRSLAARYTERTGVRVDLRHQEMERRFPPEIETAAYRTIQEALTNVARHAGTDTAAVSLFSDGVLMVSVSDRGDGFDPDAIPLGMSSGLAGMRERVALAGGTLEIESTRGVGTTVIAEFPLPAGDAPDTEEGSP